MGSRLIFRWIIVKTMQIELLQVRKMIHIDRSTYFWVKTGQKPNSETDNEYWTSSLRFHSFLNRLK